MENNFEKYIEQNQEQFEKGSPSPEVWQKLGGQLVKYHEKKIFTIRRTIVKWSVAASIVIIAGAGLLFYFMYNGRNNTRKEFVKNILPPEKLSPDSNTSLDSQKIINQKLNLQQKLAENPFPLKKLPPAPAPVGKNGYRQSLFYYAGLVEEKQKQINRLQKTNPDLYRDLQKATDDLNAIYLKLKDKLPASIDQQKILMDMIDNLRMQAIILNNQLQILEKISTPNSHNDDKKEDDI